MARRPVFRHGNADSGASARCGYAAFCTSLPRADGRRAHAGHLPDFSDQARRPGRAAGAHQRPGSLRARRLLAGFPVAGGSVHPGAGDDFGRQPGGGLADLFLCAARAHQPAPHGFPALFHPGAHPGHRIPACHGRADCRPQLPAHKPPHRPAEHPAKRQRGGHRDGGERPAGRAELHQAAIAERFGRHRPPAAGNRQAAPVRAPEWHARRAPGRCPIRCFAWCW